MSHRPLILIIKSYYFLKLQVVVEIQVHCTFIFTVVFANRQIPRIAFKLLILYIDTQNQFHIHTTVIRPLPLKDIPLIYSSPPPHLIRPLPLKDIPLIYSSPPSYKATSFKGHPSYLQ
jgi:hypothetical protein